MSLDYRYPLHATDRRPVPVSGSSNMNLNLASNNPFRRAISPNPSGFPLAPAQFRGPPPTNGAVNNENRPPPPRQNTNPFLDNYQVPAYPVAIPSQNAQRSPGKPIQPPSHGMSTSPRKNNFGSNVPVEAMNGMGLNERPQPGRRSPSRGGAPPSSYQPPQQNHRHSRSNDENKRAGVPASPEKLLDIFATPEHERVKPSMSRRNSDTSVLDVRLEERRERRKAREIRARDGRSRDHGSSAAAAGKPKKPNVKMDLIDKLDVTSIYGTGMFHHDGPFDACRPHRNRSGKTFAPMQAFPEGSANNTMGGSNQLKKFDIARYHGREAEAFQDFDVTNATAPELTRLQKPALARDTTAAPPSSFDARSNIEPVHGQQSTGLGTSTFLEGAPVPASRLALQRAPSEQDGSAAGGLGRKKSLAQRFRGISRPRQQGVTSPDARYVYVDDLRSPTPPVPSLQNESAGGRGRMVEVNPFFNENQTQVIDGKTVDVSETVTRNRGVSSPQVPLYRMKTNESANGDEAPSGGGLLSRMKSLRAGRPRRERRDT